MSPGPLVIIVSGSAATLSLVPYLTEIRELDVEMVVLLTHSAERFIPREVVGWLADRVITADSASLNPVQLALTSGAIVVLPASAHLLALGALGLASTPAATTLLAAPGPRLWFPHMNRVMWNKAMVGRHVAALRAEGDTVIDPRPCEVFEMWRGSRGEGISILDPDSVVAIVRDWLEGSRP
jgi:phosphopantothenoylcysteine decarboxylase